MSREEEGLLDALLRDIKTRQMLLKDVLEDDEDYGSLDFVGSLRMSDGVDAFVSKISDLTGMKYSDYRSQASVRDAFNFLRERIQAAGIFVLLVKNLGSHHSNISLEAFRGIALSMILPRSLS